MADRLVVAGDIIKGASIVLVPEVMSERIAAALELDVPFDPLVLTPVRVKVAPAEAVRS
jgi:hypothetical protein